VREVQLPGGKCEISERGTVTRGQMCKLVRERHGYQGVNVQISERGTSTNE